MRWPVDNAEKVISSRFAKRRNPITGEDESHMGLDFAVGNRAPLYAVESGRVLYARPADGFGNWVVIVGDSGNTYVYGHMANPTEYVKAGQRVSEGQRIASAGSAGQSTGPHLHFEVHPQKEWRAGSQIDPLPFLRRGIGKVADAAKIDSSNTTWDAVMAELIGKN